MGLLADNLITYLLTPAAQVAMIMALAEICKRMEFVNAKFIPLVDLFLGLASGIFVYGYILDYGIEKGAIIGIALGLISCGVFSGAKNVLEGGEV